MLDTQVPGQSSCIKDSKPHLYPLLFFEYTNKSNHMHEIHLHPWFKGDNSSKLIFITIICCNMLVTIFVMLFENHFFEFVLISSIFNFSFFAFMPFTFPYACET